MRLVTDRGVAVAQACRDLEFSESVLRRWMREFEDTPSGALPGHGRLGQEQAEIAAPRKEVARLKAERDILTDEDQEPVLWTVSPAKTDEGERAARAAPPPRSAEGRRGTIRHRRLPAGAGVPGGSPQRWQKGLARTARGA
ncbi:transposase [Wenxinia saemankumensis]|uniref:transposase n=1 Tax=Wenxinia saemankumensis TaxID=1447782 RepID=UPI00093470E6